MQYVQAHCEYGEIPTVGFRARATVAVLPHLLPACAEAYP
jgi:hypothetical protein